MKLNAKIVFPLVCMVFAFGSGWAKEASKEDQRAEIRKASKDVLAELYREQPSAQKAIQNAAGYGVFKNFGMKIFVAGGGKGRGMVVNNKTGKETFMKMVEVQAGLGMGVKKFNVIFVFENPAALNEFIDSGWEVGGQTTAAAVSESEGAEFARAISVKPGVWMYQLTDTGLALELTGKGTKYYKDDDLN